MCCVVEMIACMLMMRLWMVEEEEEMELWILVKVLQLILKWRGEEALKRMEWIEV